MYKAIICELMNVHKHPNADRLGLASLNGNQIVVSLDAVEGQQYVFFPTDGKLSEEFCEKNDLIGRHDPVTGERRGGYFSDNRRVRVQKFRGERSDGFGISVESLKYTGYKLNNLKVGFEFEELNGHKICEKYFTPATLRSQKQTGKTTRANTKYFNKHFETEQFRNVADKIPAMALITITEKFHGTSHRVALVKDKVKHSGIFEFIARLFSLKPALAYKVMHGSRNVVLDDFLTDNFHGGDFRAKSVGSLGERLNKGECVYLEIVGYSGIETPIMTRHDVAKLKDKELIKKYGKTMIYSYGCEVGGCKPYVYRISHMNDDGNETDLAWWQVKARCKELGVEPVAELDQFIYIGNVEALRERCEALSSGPSVIDSSHIREGICIRVEHPDMFTIVKLKNFDFLQMESNAKDDDTVVDAEEEA